MQYPIASRSNSNGEPSNSDKPAPRNTSMMLPIDQFFSEMTIGFFHIRLLLVCGFGFAAAAIEVALTGFLFIELAKEWDMNHYQLGLLPSIVGFGSILGEIFWGHAADQYGRRNVFVITVVIVVVFGIASAFSPNYTAIYILRFFVGFGYGGNIAVDFTIFAELIPTQQRGRMLFYMSAFFPIGQVFTVLIAWAVIPSYGWRTFLIICVMPCAITACLRPLIPESPRWLLLNGYHDEALRVCREMAATNGQVPEDLGIHEDTRLTLENNSSPIAPGIDPYGSDRSQYGAGSTSVPGDHGSRDDEASGGSARFFCGMPLFCDLFDRNLWRSTAGLLMLVAGLGFAGYCSTTFMPTFLQMKGLKLLNIYQTMTYGALAQLPGVILAGIAAETVGRVPPCKVALVFVAIALAIFAEADGWTWITVSVCLVNATLEFGWALFHVYTPEAFPTTLRATSCGFISAFGSVVSMCAPFLTAWLVETKMSESIVAAYFASLVLVCGIAVFFLIHVETKDRDLSDTASQLVAGDNKDKVDSVEGRALTS